MSASAGSAGQLDVEIAEEEGRTTLRLRGELDIATAQRLEQALAHTSMLRGGTLVIDLGGVAFMDSTGLRVLIRANRAAGEGGYRFAVVTGGSPAERVFELTRVHEHIEIVADPAAL